MTRGLAAALLAGALIASPAFVGAIEPGRLWTIKFPDLAAMDSLEAHGRSEAAQAWLDSVLAARRPPAGATMRMHAFLRRGTNRLTRGDMAGCQSDIDEALGLAAAAGDTFAIMGGTLVVLSGRATRGDFAAADSLLDRLLTLSRRTGSLQFQGRALNVRAYMRRNRGQMDQALADYENALKLLEACRDERGALQTRVGIANVSYERGDLERARSAYIAVIEHSRRAGQPFTQATALTDLAMTEFNLGNPEIALDELGLAEPIYREIEDYSGLMHLATCRISILMTLGQRAALEQPLQSFRQEAERAHDGKMTAWMGGRLALLRAGQGRAREALLILRDVESRSDSLPVEVRSRIQIQVADVYAVLGRPSEALARYERILDPASRVPDAGIRVDALTGSCRMMIDLGRSREALLRLAAFQPPSGPTSSGGWKVDSAAVAARAFAKLSRLDSAEVCMRRAIELTEQRRQRARTPEWRETEDLRRPDLLAEYATLLLGPEGMTPDAARIRHAFDELERHRALTFRERLAAPSHDADGNASGGAPVTLDVLQRSVLRDGEVLIEYFLSDKQGVMFVIDRRSARVRWVPEAGRVADARAYAFGWLSNPTADSGERDRAVAELRRLLIGDLAPRLAGSRVLVAADGPLSQLPFSCVLNPPGQPAAPEWALIPSATVLRAIRARGTRSPPRAMLAMAVERAPDGTALDGARREVDGLARDFHPVDTRLGQRDMNQPVPLARLGEYEVVHLAGHGVVDADSPWRSGLMLNTGTATGDYVRGTDVAGLRLGTRLCVLSSCSSAGVPIPGEGMGGLAGAFLVAGVPTVVASLWQVDDRATAQLMHAFYRKLAAGASASAALCQAQRELQSRGATRAAYYWSGFVLLGDPDTTVRLRPRGSQPR